MAVDVQDEVAVVTGAGVGSGLAIARHLLAAGALVALTDLAETEASAAVVRSAGGRAVFVPADLTRDEDARAVVERAVGTFDGLSVLVNNAGGGGDVPPHFPDASPAGWTRTLELNLRVPLLVAQVALPHLRAAGGVVVNISSTAGIGTEPYACPEYGAAKAGLVRATTCLARRDGVRFTCVVPDWLATDRGLAEYAGLPPAERARVAPPVPLARLCAAVADLVADDTAAGRVVVLHR